MYVQRVCTDWYLIRGADVARGDADANNTFIHLFWWHQHFHLCARHRRTSPPPLPPHTHTIFDSIVYVQIGFRGAALTSRAAIQMHNDAARSRAGGRRGVASLRHAQGQFIVVGGGNLWFIKIWQIYVYIYVHICVYTFICVYNCLL